MGKLRAGVLCRESIGLTSALISTLHVFLRRDVNTEKSSI